MKYLLSAMTRRYYTAAEPTGANPVGNGNPSGQNGGSGAVSGDPTQNGGQQQDPQPVTFTVAQQEELNRIIGKTRQDARDAAQKDFDSKLQKQKDETAAQDAARKGEFEKLYADEKVKRESLEPKLTEFAAKVDSLAVRVHNGIDAEIKEWPDSIKKSDPGKDVDAETRLTWVDNMRDIAKELSGRRAPSTGFGGGPSSGGPNNANTDPTNQYLQNTYKRPDAPKQ